VIQPDVEASEALRYDVLHLLAETVFASAAQLAVVLDREPAEVLEALSVLAREDAVARAAVEADVDHDAVWHLGRWSDIVLDRLADHSSRTPQPRFSLAIEVGEADSQALDTTAHALGGSQHMCVLRPSLTGITRGIRTPELGVTVRATDWPSAEVRARQIVVRLRVAAGLRQRPQGRAVALSVAE
jgi:hypothetical protein